MDVPIKLYNESLSGETLTANETSATSGYYAGIDFATATNPITAWITSASWSANNIFSTSISTVPCTLVSDGSSSTPLNLGLTASIGECVYGIKNATLSLVLSTTWLSGDGVTSVAVVTSPASAMMGTFSIDVSTLNLAQGGYICSGERIRLYVNGEI